MTEKKVLIHNLNMKTHAGSLKVTLPCKKPVEAKSAEETKLLNDPLSPTLMPTRTGFYPLPVPVHTASSEVLVR